LKLFAICFFETNTTDSSANIYHLLGLFFDRLKAVGGLLFF